VKPSNSRGKASPYEPFNWADWIVEYCLQHDTKIPNQHCQREKDHDGPHESYTRKWERL